MFLQQQHNSRRGVETTKQQGTQSHQQQQQQLLPTSRDSSVTASPQLVQVCLAFQTADSSQSGTC
jgi:hypothetical protein